MDDQYETSHTGIKGTIDDIWNKYDRDNSGHLDRDETRKFVIETMGSL